MAKFVLTAQLQLQPPRNIAAVARQIQNQLNNIKVNVAVSGASATVRDLDKVKKGVDKAASAADRMGKIFAVSIKRFAAFSIATRAVGLFTRGLGDAVSQAISFERELIKVSQVTGKSMKNLRGLTKEITRLSTSMGVASKSLISVSRVLSQAGLSAKQTEIALATLARTELAPTFENITQTAEGAIAIFNQFGKGAGALEKQLGAINAVAGKFAVEAGDLISVIRRTGGVFKSAGGDLNELIALFTSVRSTTRESAESIATGLRTIFTRIQRPKTIEFLKQYGVELLDLEGKFVGPFEAVRKLSNAMAGLEQGDITFIKIAEQLGGFRQIGKVLPLLQQFSVAQKALNVAQQGSGSLTRDQAKAQAALAVRITKVKEEFISLIREFTATKTFQLMAGTALSLASALIRIADAAKELLPILTALMAVKMAKGMMGFVGGLKSGMPMMGMARGGLVPGSGNRDTVPAVLTPGEFVVRKKSVNAIGAGNLEGMNRYATGGKVNINPGAIGGFFLRPTQGDPKSIPMNTTRLITHPSALEQMGHMKGQSGGIGHKDRKAALLKANKAQQAAMLGISEKELGTRISVGDMTGHDKPGILRSAERLPIVRSAVSSIMPGGPVDKAIGLGANVAGTKVPVIGNIQGFFPGGRDLKKNSKISKLVARETKTGLKKTVMKLGPQVNQMLRNPMIDANENTIKQAANNLSNDPNATATAEGFAYEGLINAITGATLGGKGTTWDFGAAAIKSARNSLVNLFGSDADYASITALIKADAKRTASSDAKRGIIDKLSRDINKGDFSGVSFTKAASGGAVGSDTVPALLTPGEFVVNKKSSQAIGYGNLASMNRFADGGQVGPLKFSPTSGKGSKHKRNYGGAADIGVKVKELGQHLLKMNVSYANVNKITDVFAIQLERTGSAATALGIAAKDAGIKFATTGQLRAEAEKKAAAAATTNTIAKIKEAEAAALSVRKRDAGMAKAFSGQMTGEGMDQKQIGGKLAVQQHGRVFGREGGKSGISSGVGQEKAVAQATKFFERSVRDAGVSAENAAKSTKVYSRALLEGKSSATAGTVALKSVGVSGQMVTKSDYKKVKAANVAASADMKKAKAGGGGMQALSMGLMMGAGMLQQFTNELEGTSKEVADGLLQMVMTISMVMMALEAFGVKMSMGAFMGGHLSPEAGGMGKGIAAGVAVGAAAFMGMSKVIDSYSGVHKKAKKTIEEGNVATAGHAAAMSQASKDADVLGYAAVGVGAAIAGPLGGAVGALVGGLIKMFAQTEAGAAVMGGFRDYVLTIFGADNTALVKAKAEADAAGVRAQKSLTEASEEAAENLQKVEAGAMGVSEALSSGKIAKTAKDIEEAQLKRAGNLKTQQEKADASSGASGAAYIGGGALAGGIAGAGIGAYAGTLGGPLAPLTVTVGAIAGGAIGGLAGGISTAIGNAGSKSDLETMSKEDKEKTEAENKALLGDASIKKLMGIQARQTSFGGGNFEQFLSTLKQGEGGKALVGAMGDKDSDEYKQAEKEFKAISDEVDRVKARMAALNLGLREMTAATAATAVGMDNLMNRFEVGSLQIDDSFNILMAGVTEAGAHIKGTDFSAALGDVERSMKAFGANETELKKFTAGLKATYIVQKKAKDIFNEKFIAGLNKDMEAGGDKADPKALRQKFAEKMVEALPDDLQKEVGGQLSKLIETGAISTEDMEAFQGGTGDMSVITNLVKDLVTRQQDILKTHHDRLMKLNKQLISVTKNRIDSERKFIAAQKTAIDMQMEAREISAKYGGSTYGTSEKRSLLLEKANVGARGMGLSDLKGGGLGAIRSRGSQIGMNFANIERAQQASDQTGKRVAGGGAAAVATDERQKDLENANKEHANLIRELIKLEEEELQILEKKNALEKDSLSSLMKGDLEGFLEQQAAVGATAAIATGDKGMMGMFGADALGGAFENLKKMQEGGVQSIYGQQIGGAGGLKERGAQAALGARGLKDLQSAQLAAGTTPEEEAKKRNIRGLAGALSETGEMGADMMGMKANTAEIRCDIATIEITKLQTKDDAGQSQLPELQTSARGGLIYANNGMFVPKGTDTVPAMLTPGEFVVRRQSVQRGNNLQILRAMNGGDGARFQSGGQVGYYNKGDLVSGGMSVTVTNAAQISTMFDKFNSDLSSNITNLANIKFQIKLDTTNVNVNLTGTSFLAGMKEEIRTELMAEVSKKLDKLDFNMAGEPTFNASVVS